MVTKITQTSSNSSAKGAVCRLALAAIFAVTVAGFEAPAFAGNLIQNGQFTSYTGTIGTAGGGLNTVGDYTGGASLGNWTVVDVGSSQGLAFLYMNGNQGSTTANGNGVTVNGRFGSYGLYDPGNVAGPTPHGGAIPNTSPGGGNFIVADGAASYSVAIYQTLTGLTPGTVYAVSFYYAAGQQDTFSGNTTEGWQVSLENSAQTSQVTANGTTIQDTPTQANISGTSTPGLASGGFQAWALETMDFTASSATQVLTFLSMGTPDGEPPADLLSDVSLAATTGGSSSPVPEPASLATSAIGMAALVGLIWYRRLLDRRAAAGRAE